MITNKTYYFDREIKSQLRGRSFRQVLKVVDSDGKPYIAKTWNPFESEINRGISHPGIVPYLGGSRVEGNPDSFSEDDDFMIFGYVEGRPLYELNGSQKVRNVAMLGSGILTPLIYLDGLDRAHGDLSAGNVLVGNFGVTLADLESSPFFREKRKSRVTEHTIRHASPEVIFSAEMIRESSEVYSLGTLMYRLLDMNGFDYECEIERKKGAILAEKGLKHHEKLLGDITQTDRHRPQDVSKLFGLLNSHSVMEIQNTSLDDSPRMRGLLEACLEIDFNNRPGLEETNKELSTLS